MALGHRRVIRRRIAGAAGLFDRVEVELRHGVSPARDARRVAMTAAIDPVDLAARLIACPSVTPASGAGVRRAGGGAGGDRLHRPPLHPGRGAGRAGRESVRVARLRARRISPSPAISTWCRRARAGRATPSRPRSRGGLLHGRGAVDMKGGIAAFVAAAAADGACGHAQPDHHRRRGRPGHLRHAADHGLDGRARHPPGHDPDRRADLRGPARRHRQDRPARLGQHVGDGAGRAGPCRLPAPRRQSGAEARQGDRRAGGAPSRRRQ